MADENTNSVNESVSEQYKIKGNESFKSGKYNEAIEYYTLAIKTSQASNEAQDKNLHIYYSNRALCHIRLENFGSAIEDAGESIKCYPSFSKAYYRRGIAYFNLLKYSLARKDFMMVLNLTENDRDAQSKIQICTKLIKQEKFMNAISTDRSKLVHETLDFSAPGFVVPDEYSGPHYISLADNSKNTQSGNENNFRSREFVIPKTLDSSLIRESFVTELIDFLKNPENRLHRRYAYMIVYDLIQVLKEVAPKPLVRINIGKQEHITVCGDIHGQFFDLLNIFDINGLPSVNNGYLFNGDFVDRGSFSVEVILVLFTLKIMYPYHVHLARGNHETKNLNKLYGFEGEVLAKYDSGLYDLISEAFCFLPLAHVINDKVFVVHGGLCSEDNVKLNDIEQLYTRCEPADSGFMSSLLWSDPQQKEGRSPSPRGVGCNFGPDVTLNFLKTNNLDYIIRSHEVKQEGYSVDHDGKCITVFSAPNYCDSMGNKGAFIKIHEYDLKPNFVQFYAVPHPPVPAMKYANSMLSYGM
ncbi:phosphoprotein phosphatase related protein [Cryptosporidium ubiquitum]|uniref:Serine/threonine-protein phosphatase T n=1 Tax=Cryptosporidium ubiquitum TaxID=857276 RepID=A0A1J4MEH7_9CRYT|nr:phosphoprotein phosphatase related protein [Cryptosporidium ubiquitum]OII71867.1 phosphoprotein phosphatase related protein [Cryptosporidium ubiquitum]